MLVQSLKPTLRPCLYSKRLAEFVKQKEVDAIMNQYKAKGDSYFNLFKMVMEVCKFRMLAGKDFAVKDITKYQKLAKKTRPLTDEQIQLQLKVQANFRKVFPLFIIWALPFSPAFFVLYVKFFPDALPTWFEIQEDYNRKQKQYRDVRHQAALRIAQRHIESNSKIAQMNDSRELRQLANALIGKHRDGTRVLSLMMKRPVSFDNTPLAAVSSWLLKRQIDKFLRHDWDGAKHSGTEDEAIVKRLQQVLDEIANTQTQDKLTEGVSEGATAEPNEHKDKP